MLPILLGSLALGSPALEALDEGDALWFSGRRGPGQRAWREALRAADESSDGRAIEAMARIRLLRGATTWALLVQGPRIDDALAACDVRQALCRLALADYHLLGSRTLGARPELGRRLLDAVDLPGRVAVRRRLFEGDTASVLSGSDGLTRAVEEGFVPDPGPSVVGGGLVSGPSVGIGLGVHLSHPDLLRRGLALALDGFAATRGVGVGLRLETPGRVGVVLAGIGQRSRWFTLTGAVPVTTGIGRIGAALRLGRFGVEGGVQARVEAEPDEQGATTVWLGHGAWAGGTIDDRSWREGRAAGFLVVVESEATLPPLASYERFGQVLDLRAYARPGRGVVTGRLRVEGILGTPPEIRRPTIGGARVFRGARPGIVRGDSTLVVGAEARHPLLGPVWGAAFIEGALVAARGHVGGGGGLRYVLPPQPRNTVRLDLGVSDLGWQVHAAWGEAW